MHLHNVYLQYAAERGVPALIAYLWFLGKMLFDFRRAARGTLAREGERRFVLHGAVAVMIAALSAGWYELNLNDGEILTLFLPSRVRLVSGLTSLTAAPATVAPVASATLPDIPPRKVCPVNPPAIRLVSPD